LPYLRVAVHTVPPGLAPLGPKGPPLVPPHQGLTSRLASPHCPGEAATVPGMLVFAGIRAGRDRAGTG